MFIKVLCTLYSFRFIPAERFRISLEIKRKIKQLVSLCVPETPQRNFSSANSCFWRHIEICHHIMSM